MKFAAQVILISLGTFFLGVLLFALSGCASIAPSKFDPIEQANVNNLRQQAETLKKVCGDRQNAQYQFASIQHETDWLATYIKYSDDRDLQSIWARVILVVADAAAAPAGSKAFCEASADNLALTFERVMATIGGRAR
jgi:hypothetical protein